MRVTLFNIRMMLENEAIYIQAQTYAFTVLAISQLFNAAGMRNIDRTIFKMKHFDNKLMIIFQP